MNATWIITLYSGSIIYVLLSQEGKIDSWRDRVSRFVEWSQQSDAARLPVSDAVFLLLKRPLAGACYVVLVGDCTGNVFCSPSVLG